MFSHVLSQRRFPRILGDPGADSGGERKSNRAGKNGTKKSKERREEPLGTIKSAANFSAPAQEGNLFFLSGRSARKKIRKPDVPRSPAQMARFDGEIMDFFATGPGPLQMEVTSLHFVL